MAKKEDLTTWVHQALRELGGEAHHVEVAKWVWNNREDELRKSGDLFFTWQYDLRWAAFKLRQRDILVPDDGRGAGIWKLR